MEIQNRGTKIAVIVISTLYQLSSASICVSQGFSFQSHTLYDQWLTSPSYPNNYPSYSNCLWRLQRPTSLYAVKLTFSSFFLESKTSCSDDYVEIRDGDLLSSSKLIGTFCGSRLPPIIVSNYKYIFVRFVSDFDNYPFIRKFSATFRAIVPVRSSSECQLNGPFLHNNNLQLSSPSGGTFSSPSYPSHYPDSMLCTWKITAPSGKRVKLYFNYFRLESGVCSSNDYLEVRDGSSSTSLKKGTYCGSYAPTITSSGRYLWLRFRSDAQLRYKGFQARYEVVSKSSSMVGTVVGVLIGIGVLVAIIVFVIYLAKRKNRRVVAARALSSTTATTTVTTSQSIPAGYTHPIPQQYPSVAEPPPRPPPGTHVQPGPPQLGPHHSYPQGGPYNSAPGIPMNPAYGAYTHAQPPGAMATTQAPPPYYQTEGMKAAPTNVEL